MWVFIPPSFRPRIANIGDSDVVVFAIGTPFRPKDPCRDG
jgi:hypothetical protein